jgi:hypothetical protein
MLLTKLCGDFFFGKKIKEGSLIEISPVSKAEGLVGGA